MSRNVALLSIAMLALAMVPGTAHAMDPREPTAKERAAMSAASAAALGDGSELAPCVLVGRSDVVRATGLPASVATEKVAEIAVHRAGSVRTQYCVYGSDVVVGRMPLGDVGRSFYGKYRKSLASAPGYREVRGIGDEAFTAKGQLNVRRGKTGLIIDVGSSRRTALSELQAEKALATVALSRL